MLALKPAQVAVELMMAEPPLDTGVANATLICAFPAVAVPMVGAPGTVTGVALADGDDAALMPAALVAVTVHI